MVLYDMMQMTPSNGPSILRKDFLLGVNEASIDGENHVFLMSQQFDPTCSHWASLCQHGTSASRGGEPQPLYPISMHVLEC